MTDDLKTWKTMARDHKGITIELAGFIASLKGEPGSSGSGGGVSLAKAAALSLILG